MKRLSLLLIFLMIFVLASCVSPFWHPPTEQNGTIWQTDNPPMYFIVDRTEDMATIGQTKDNLKIKFEFGFAFNVFVYDVEKIVHSDSGGSNTNNALLFKGDCKFKKTKFTITVTESEIDSVKVGDKITFNRVDELPDWAKEIETDASLTEAPVSG